jgi:hypothetical protein
MRHVGSAGTIAARTSLALIIALALSGTGLVGASAKSPEGAKGTAPQTIVLTVEELRSGGLLTEESGPLTFERGGGITPQWGCVINCLWVNNVKYVGKNEPFVTMAQANGPGKLTLDISRTVSNGFTASVGVDAKVVSAGVEFNVTWSATQRYVYETQVPNNACWTIRAYNIYHDYTFDVWHNPLLGDPHRIGSGRAWKFMGIKFVLAKSC